MTATFGPTIYLAPGIRHDEAPEIFLSSPSSRALNSFFLRLTLANLDFRAKKRRRKKDREGEGYECGIIGDIDVLLASTERIFYRDLVRVEIK